LKFWGVCLFDVGKKWTGSIRSGRYRTGKCDGLKGEWQKEGAKKILLLGAVFVTPEGSTAARGV